MVGIPNKKFSFSLKKFLRIILPILSFELLLSLLISLVFHVQFGNFLVAALTFFVMIVLEGLSVSNLYFNMLQLEKNRYIYFENNTIYIIENDQNKTIDIKEIRCIKLVKSASMDQGGFPIRLKEYYYGYFIEYYRNEKIFISNVTLENIPLEKFLNFKINRVKGVLKKSDLNT